MELFGIALEQFGRLLQHLKKNIWTEFSVWTAFWNKFSVFQTKKMKYNFYKILKINELTKSTNRHFWTFGRLDVWNKKRYIYKTKNFFNEENCHFDQREKSRVNNKN